MKLSEKERRFVEAYMGQANGNATQAAILAGYAANSADVTASRLLGKARVIEAIKQRRSVLEAASIADAKERRELLTMYARSDRPQAALRAIDVLNRMDGLYIDRQIHEGTFSVDVTGARDRLASTLASLASRTAGSVRSEPQR